RGRPAKVFALTDQGRDAFEHAYDDLAAQALRFLETAGGTELVADFARHRIGELEQRYRRILADVDPPSRVAALAKALSDDGYAASAAEAPVGEGEQLCQHHCPVAHVAEE